MSTLLQFHENPRVIALWQRWLGSGLTWFSEPGRRRSVLALLALGVGVGMSLQALRKHAGLPVPHSAWGQGLVVVAQFALLWLVFQAAANFSRLPAPLRRHPQLALHALYWGMLAVLVLSTPAAGHWRDLLAGLTLIVPMLIWRCGYLLMGGQHGRVAGTRPADHLFYLWPAWGGSDTPYGKGLAYLSQWEARTPQDLARSQLAGLKLLMLAVVWRLVLTAFEGMVYGPGNGVTRALGGATLAVPTLPSLLVADRPVALAVAWASIYCELIEDVLRLAIKGHLIIGVLRLFGYNVFRNTYKPLLAESVVEFWNRYFHYFKELLSIFFFMPVFTGLGRRLRQWPSLRLFMAVFAAAFVGNVYYHVIKESAAMVQGQFLDVLMAHRSRMFYCLLLACGIFVSMLREPGRRGAAQASTGWVRLRRMMAVWTFFALITIWNADGGAPFLARVRFAAGLLGFQ